MFFSLDSISINFGILIGNWFVCACVPADVEFQRWSPPAIHHYFSWKKNITPFKTTNPQQFTCGSILHFCLPYLSHSFRNNHTQTFSWIWSTTSTLKKSHNNQPFLKPQRSRIQALISSDAHWAIWLIIILGTPSISLLVMTFIAKVLARSAWGWLKVMGGRDRLVKMLGIWNRIYIYIYRLFFLYTQPLLRVNAVFF